MSGPSNPEHDDKPGPGQTASPDAPSAGPSPVPPAEPTPETGQDGTPETAATAAETRIAQLEAERDDFKDRYLRAYAEAENIRKRTEREKSDLAKYAIAGFARDVLTVSDNLQRAISAVADSGGEHSGALKALLEGVQLTDQELRKSLERHGVRPIEAAGVLFDPNLHQAVMEQENVEVVAGTVLKVFQEGYKIEDRVLRPAMVVVARGGAKPTKPAPDNDEGAPAPSDEAGGDAAGDDAGPDPASNTGSNAP